MKTAVLLLIATAAFAQPHIAISTAAPVRAGATATLNIVLSGNPTDSTGASGINLSLTGPVGGLGDLNGNGTCDAIDAQRILNAIGGAACRTGQ